MEREKATRALSSSRYRRALVAGLLAAGLLVWNAAVRPGNRLEDQKAPRRYWEDVSIAVSAFFYPGEQAGVPTIHVGFPQAMDYRQHYRSYLLRMVDEAGIEPWQFWRTVPIRPSLKKDRILPRDVDDPGRPALLSAAFRLLGGAAPYLGLWLGILFACPLLLWMASELWRAGLPTAGTLLPALIACSAFMVDTLTLAYSAQAFYSLGVLLLITVSINAGLSRSARQVSLAAGILLAGGVFALCVLGRMSVMALLPAFLLAIALRVSRLGVESSKSFPRRVWVGALAMALFITPYAMVRQPRHHAVWSDIWVGLGDFDRAYGHVWSDSVLRSVLRREGVQLSPGVGVEYENPETESILRRLVLEGIGRDPRWYAEILVRRAAATLSQRKLWPYGPRDGRSVAPSLYPNEGRMDVYYSLATSVDFLALGRFRLEIPISLMVAPTLILVLLRVFGARVGISPVTRARIKGYLWTMLVLALGAASLPIFITTASGFEIQSFALVYFVGFAFLAEEVQRQLRLAWPARLAGRAESKLGEAATLR